MLLIYLKTLTYISKNKLFMFVQNYLKYMRKNKLFKEKINKKICYKETKTDFESSSIRYSQISLTTGSQTHLNKENQDLP